MLKKQSETVLPLPPCRSKYGRVVSLLNTATGEHLEINCKSWRCPRCAIKWARKWSTVIKEALARYNPNKILLVNLTTKEATDNITIEKAIRKFNVYFREYTGGYEYIKVVEYNRAQTQPHFHLIVCFDTLVIPEMKSYHDKALSFPENIYWKIQEFWILALTRSGGALAPVVWCQPPKGIKEDMRITDRAATYAVGYVTGKSGQGEGTETPNETWRGRRITYSKKFFKEFTAAEIWKNKLIEWFGEKDPASFMPIIKPELWDIGEVPAETRIEILDMRKLNNILDNTNWLQYVTKYTPPPKIQLIDNQYSLVL